MKKKPEILRTKFKGEIVSEFILPEKPSNKVIILCHGMPSVPKYKETMEFLSKKGFWTFFPRYRGSWESAGEFLKKSPHEDILDIIGEVPRGFSDLWSGKKYVIKNPEIYLLGGSFGGPAAILTSSSEKVKKTIAICPVIDWKSPSKDEPLGKLGGFVREAFGEGYRFSMKNWNKLKTGTFYNPIAETEKIDGSKMLLIHTKDDRSVSYKPTVKFGELTGAKVILLNKGGHTGFKLILDPDIYKEIEKFLKN